LRFHGDDSGCGLLASDTNVSALQPEYMRFLCLRFVSGSTGNLLRILCIVVPSVYSLTIEWGEIELLGTAALNWPI